jgi:hypothetical protein
MKDETTSNKKFLQGSRGRFFQKESPGRRRQKNGFRDIEVREGPGLYLAAAFHGGQSFGFLAAAVVSKAVDSLQSFYQNLFNLL